MTFAPVVLFTYNRLWHTQQTVASLQKNELAQDTEIYIYSDGGKDEASWCQVNELRGYLKTIDGFKKITVIEQEKNLGLADSVISGVTKIVNEFGKIIVLEDDIVTNPYFLKFMNDALSFYENEEKVWHISSWNYPIERTDTSETFFWRVMNCWGWATWKNRWDHFEKNTDKLICELSQEDINRFNLNGSHDFWSQVISNKNKQINTWAIYWYATIFKKNGLCLSPVKSFSRNIGFDEMGTHTTCAKDFEEIIQDEYPVKFPEQLVESSCCVLAVEQYFYKKRTRNTNYHTAMQFNKTLAQYYQELDTLKLKNEKYILYGAGTGAKLILSYMNDCIECVVDANIEKDGSLLFGKEVRQATYLQRTSLPVIISVFGREREISDFLVDNKYVLRDNIILLNFINGMN